MLNSFRSFLGLHDPDPIEISDDDNDEVQTAIQNSMGLAKYGNQLKKALTEDKMPC